jgi:hypothetical protein
MAKLNFNASEVPTQQSGYEPRPAGDYTMQVVNSDMRTTKSGTGQYLWLEFDILSGPVRGKYFERLNLFNDNAKAVEIANRQLSAICNAVGLVALQDSEQLHMKPLKVVLKVSESKDGSLQNTAKYLPVNAAPTATTAPAPAAAPQAAASAAKPWERHKK